MPNACNFVVTIRPMPPVTQRALVELNFLNAFSYYIGSLFSIFITLVYSRMRL